MGARTPTGRRRTAIGDDSNRSKDSADDPLDLELGAQVNVSPADYGIVPVAGELVRLTLDDIAIRREDTRAGEVIVNFPRIGYRVEKA